MFSETVEASFPSNLERTVASALLLLSSSPPKSEDSCSPESIESSGFSVSKSSGGSSIAEVTVDEELSRANQLTVVAFLPEFHDLKLKIVRKKRSKTILISNGKKLKTSSKPEITYAPASSESVSGITTTEVSSCLSSSSSAQSYSTETNAADKLRKAISGHMRHRAAAILKVLSNGTASEVKIRQLLGDSPSTSKALRMLLKLEEVERFGAGGRGDPYIYKIAS